MAGYWTGGKRVSDYENSIPKMIKALGGTVWGPEGRAVDSSFVAGSPAAWAESGCLELARDFGEIDPLGSRRSDHG